MNFCEPFKKYEGNKSEKIRNMINDRLRKKIQAKIKELSKDKELIKLDEKIKQMEKKFNELREKRNTGLNFLQIESNYGEDKYRPSNGCLISQKDTFLLQKASDMYALGMKKEANQIWNDMIEKHKLV